MKLYLTLAAVIVWPLLLAGDDLAVVDRSDQDQVRKKYEETRRDIDDLLTSQSDIYDQLAQVEKDLERSSRAQRRFSRDIRRLDSEIANVKAELRNAEQSLTTEHSLYKDHLVALYKRGSISSPKAVAFTTDASLSADHSYLLSRLLLADREYMRSLYLRIDGYQELLTELTQKQVELASLLDARRDEERGYEDALRQRERLLALLKSQQRQKVEQLADLQESSTWLADIIAESEGEGADSVVNREREMITRMKGRLFWPAQGKIVEGFGVHRDSLTNLTSKCSGVRLSVRPGAKVVAALTGEVVYIGWARGLEKFVVVDHGGKVYSLYGNLDQISVKEGDQIIRGEPFAVAATDQLHFEIREGKTAVDPLTWLKQ